MARTYKQLSLEERSLLQTQLVMGWQPAAEVSWQSRRLCNVIVPTWVCNARC
jgi:hypothetical protein